MAKEQNPQITRQKLLDAAFELFYRNGFRATGLNDVVSAAGLSKGALYNHFASKMDLGYAVVDEVLAPLMRQFWIEPYQNSQNPLSATRQIIETVSRRLGCQDEQLGCPLNNLVQEMSAIDAGFRQRLRDLIEEWQTAIVASFKRAKSAGVIQCDVAEAEVAVYIISVFQGAMGMTKNTASAKPLKIVGKQLLNHLDSLFSQNNLHVKKVS